MNWTKLWEDGLDLDEEFEPFESMGSGSCQEDDDAVAFEHTPQTEEDDE